MAFGSKCDGCEVRDRMIETLTAQVEDFQKSILALADAKAYIAKYPRGIPPRGESIDAEGHPLRQGPSSPAELRRQRFKGADSPAATLTQEEYEKTFQAERDAMNRGEAV